MFNAGEKSISHSPNDSKKFAASVLDNSAAALDPNLVGLRQGVRYMTNGLKARTYFHQYIHTYIHTYMTLEYQYINCNL